MKQDGGDHFSFYTDGRKSWDIEGDNGSSLSFRAIMTDQFGDHHGYMILRVPSGTVAKGQATENQGHRQCGKPHFLVYDLQETC
ncbi:MAG: hypothetical protein MZV63_61310 [Marinilabiliales bacterium]|nr:hypothetical protein [Marinilabiliales bacterium]